MNKEAPSQEAKVERNTRQLRKLLVAIRGMERNKRAASMNTRYRVGEIHAETEKVVCEIGHLLENLMDLEREWEQMSM